MPNLAEAIDISKRIEDKYGYPQAFGAIDGTHIHIKPPANGLADFRNRKGWPSMNVQAVCDDQLVFRDVCCKHPGSCHDAYVLSDSWLYHNLDTAFPRYCCEISDVRVPLHLLSDPAYPFTQQFMKVYPGRNLDEESDSFNAYHNSARSVIELAFGRLKARWRRLSKKQDVHYTFSPKLIMAFFILHNICELQHCPFNPHLLEHVAAHEGVYQQPTEPAATILDNDAEPIAVRNAIKRHLASTRELRRSMLAGPIDAGRPIVRLVDS